MMAAFYSQDIVKQIEHVMSQVDQTKTSNFIDKLKLIGLASSDLDQATLVAELVYAGILDDLIPLSKKIHAVIINTNAYCLVQLEELQIFKSTVDAMTKIESLKVKREEGYFDGSFEFICGYIHLFQFQDTKRASGAVENDFKFM